MSAFSQADLRPAVVIHNDHFGSYPARNRIDDWIRDAWTFTQINAVCVDKPQIDYEACVHCGKCATVCPTGTIVEKPKGFRMLLGGKLGRHPQLARELPGIFNESEVLDVVEYCINFYKQHSKNGKRFAHIFRSSDFEALAAKVKGKRTASNEQ